MQILGELFFANQGRKMGVMPSASGTKFLCIKIKGAR